MVKNDNEICIKKFVEYIIKCRLMGKNEDKILITSIDAAVELIENGFYDVWLLNMFDEYSNAKEKGISPQFAKGFINNGGIFIPFREENRKELSIDNNADSLFPQASEFDHIIVLNEAVINQPLELVAINQINPILGFCLPEEDISIASLMYLYSQAIKLQGLEKLYELKTEKIDGYQYTLVNERVRY